NPKASATTAAAAAANRLQTTRRGARVVARADAWPAPAATTRARRWAGGSVTVANGSRPSVARSRRTSSARAGSPATRRSNVAASSGESSPSTYSTARSSAVGSVTSSLHEVGERRTQPEEPAPTPAFHRPEGRVEGRRDLRLREALVVDHLEHAALVGGQLGDGAAHARGALARRDPVDRGRGQVDRRRAPPGGAEDAEAPPPASQPIDGPRPRERRQEGTEGAAAHIVGRAPAEHHEDLLREVLGLILGLKDGAGEPVDEPAVPIVEGSERSGIGAERAEQDLVRWLGRGRLGVSSPARLEARASIVDRRGGSHTVS